MVLPVSSPPTRKFHIIQPVVVNQKKRSSLPRSAWKVNAFRCSNKIPHWHSTTGFGLPVVPEENNTQSGSLKLTCSYVSVPDSASASSHKVTFFSRLVSGCSFK